MTSAAEIVLVYAISMLMPIGNVTTYLGWIKYGILIFCISSLVVFCISWILYKRDVVRMFESVKNVLKRNK